MPLSGTFACLSGSTLVQFSVRSAENTIETAGRVITTSMSRAVMDMIVARFKEFYGNLYIELVVTDDASSGEYSCNVITVPQWVLCVWDSIASTFDLLFPVGLIGGASWI